MTDVTPYFLDHLRTLLEQARIMKSAEPKTAETRYWAVVFTDLEKTLAYAEMFLNPKVSGGPE